MSSSGTLEGEEGGRKSVSVREDMRTGTKFGMMQLMALKVAGATSQGIWAGSRNWKGNKTNSPQNSLKGSPAPLTRGFQSSEIHVGI